MSDMSKLEDLLKKKEIHLTGPIVAGTEQEDPYLVFVLAKFDNNGRRSPSAYTLNTIASEAEGLGFKLNFILVDRERADLDSSLKTMLFGKFPEAIRNSFSALAGKEANIWIEPKRAISELERKSIKDAAIQFLELFSFEKVSVNITQSENTPTPTAILTTIRIHAPCSIKQIMAELSLRHFVVPNVEWMNHRLDRLRKAGVLIRKKNGDYFLSLAGLTAQGTSKNRRSPDVVRSLALARRRT